MKKIIFLSIIITFLSCKKNEDKVSIINEVQVKLPEYSIIEFENVSIRTRMDVDAPINKRFSYSVLVTPEIKRNQIEPLFNKLIKDITSKDDDIDIITIALYSDKSLVNGGYDVAMATWEPADGEVSDEIALLNNRDSYKLNKSIPDNLEVYLGGKLIKTVKYGLSEDERKQISIEIGDAEERAQLDADKICPYKNFKSYDPKFNSMVLKNGDKFDELAEKYKLEIIKKHKINEDIYVDIIGEGIEKRWD